jgi:site-specific DNA-cytosine methylase
MSGVVRRAFGGLGHDVVSCDLLPSMDNSLDHHCGDVTPLLLHGQWDMVIAFPPCTHLSSSGARWFKEKQADGRQQEAIDFFMMFAGLDCPRTAIENPIGIMSTRYRKPDQIIHPWMFGHGETKATCLWLKGLPPLRPTDIVEGREQRIWKMGPSEDRAIKRSLTYQGIADAMAQQWG